MAAGFWGDSMTDQMLTNATALAVFSAVGLVTFNGGFGGQNTDYVLARFNERPARRNWVQVFWHVHHGGGQPDQAPSVHAMIAALDHEDFLIISSVNDGYAANYQGPSGERYLAMEAYNAAMQAAYPANYLDLHGIMVADGVANADAHSIDFDAPPVYWAPTDIHFNQDGYVKAAQEILAKLTTMGLLTSASLKVQIGRSGGR